MSHNNRHRFLLAVGVVIAAAMAFSFLGRKAPPAPPAAAPATTASVDAVADPLPVHDVAPDGQKLFGYVPNPKATAQFIRSMPRPFLQQAAPELLRAQDETPVLLYRAVYEAYAATHHGQHWVVGTQKIGDCVSWGYKHATEHNLAVQWKLGESSEWREVCSEALYGGGRVEALGRTFGGWSDGSYGSAQSKWITGWGLHFKQPYDGHDLSTYDGSRAKQWGAYGCGGQGDNGRLDEIGKLHPCDVVVVTSFREAAAAIQSGYPVAVCSGQGFASRRDGQGFAAAQGGWAHCMCFVGVRFDRPGLLCLNSWGPNWINGPKWPEDQPDGSFWVDARICDRMLAGRDSFAVSGVRGFPYKNLKNGDWVQRKPVTDRNVERGLAMRPLIERCDDHFSLAP